MSDSIHISIRSEMDIVTARQEGRAMADLMSFSKCDQTFIASAISEIARNIIAYANHGEIFLKSIHEGVKQGISIVAQDEGPGIPDIPQAMKDGFTTGNSLGMGLPGAKRLMDEFEISSEVGKGTVVKMKKWIR
jgi:serine/threonine-protein kinase RsbT